MWVGILAANHEGQDRPVFSAGADLKAVNAGDTGLGTARWLRWFVYRERRKPIIVAVDGLATAGGCEIVLAADLVVATDAVVVRAGRGEAQPRRRRRRPVPAATGDRSGRGDGGDPHGRADPGPAGLRPRPRVRLAEPGDAVAEARRLADQICL